MLSFNRKCGVTRLEKREIMSWKPLKGSMGKRVVEALIKLWRENGHLGVFTS
jgi:hypothetical protein